jgi:hypothetical protein
MIRCKSSNRRIKTGFLPSNSSYIVFSIFSRATDGEVGGISLDKVNPPKNGILTPIPLSLSQKLLIWILRSSVHLSIIKL